MRESQYAVLQNLVDQFYANFIALVKERQPNLDQARFGEATDGRVVSGREALSLGLVDSLGTVRDAFDHAKTRAGIAGARMIKYRPEGSMQPRTPYAASSDQTPDPRLAAGSAGAGEINLLQVRADGLFPSSGPSPSAVYYLWLANVP
jgi:ClpP class serine protease